MSWDAGFVGRLAYFFLYLFLSSSLYFIIIIIIVVVVTAIELSLGGSSPYTSTAKTDKNKCP
jgi:hypothetical protein